MANDELINSWAAARMLGYHVNVLFFAQKHGRGPEFELDRGKVRYRLSVIEEYSLQEVPPDAIYLGPAILNEFSAYAKDDNGKWHYKNNRRVAQRFQHKRYFPGVECERGHVAEWYVKNNQCTMCAEENRQRRNREKELQRVPMRQPWNPNSKKHCEHTPVKDFAIDKPFRSEINNGRDPRNKDCSEQQLSHGVTQTTQNQHGGPKNAWLW